MLRADTTVPPRALLLAAGIGTRLGGETRDVPKPLLPVAGKPILERSLEALADVGVQEVIVVVGYLAGRIIDGIGPTFRGMRILYVTNERYATTNDVYSLWRARGHLNEDTYLIEGDVLVSPELLRRLADPRGRSTVAVTPFDPELRNIDALLNPDSRVVRLVKDVDPNATHAKPYTAYTTISAFLLRRELLHGLVPALDVCIGDGRVHEVYETVLDEVIVAGRCVLYGVDTGGAVWHEVDDAADRLGAEYRFSPPEHRLSLLEATTEAPWRHGIVDHTFARNVYFPDGTARRTFEHELRHAIAHPASGQAALAILASSVSAHPASEVAVAPRARDILIAMLEAVGGPCLVVASAEDRVATLPNSQVLRLASEYGLECEKVAAAAAEANASIVALASRSVSAPIEAAAVVTLARALSRRGTHLVVDESLADLTPIRSGPFAVRAVDAPNVLTIKELGAPTGFVGAAVAVAATGNESLAHSLRAWLATSSSLDAAGEALLRTLPRHRKTLESSLERARADMAKLRAALNNIPGVVVTASHGATTLLRLPLSCSASEVAGELLGRHETMVATSRDDRHLRVASAGALADHRLHNALFAVLITGCSTGGARLAT